QSFNKKYNCACTHGYPHTCTNVYHVLNAKEVLDVYPYYIKTDTFINNVITKFFSLKECEDKLKNLENWNKTLKKENEQLKSEIDAHIRIIKEDDVRNFKH